MSQAALRGRRRPAQSSVPHSMGDTPAVPVPSAGSCHVWICIGHCCSGAEHTTSFHGHSSQPWQALLLTLLLKGLKTETQTLVNLPGRRAVRGAGAGEGWPRTHLPSLGCALPLKPAEFRVAQEGGRSWGSTGRVAAGSLRGSRQQPETRVWVDE